MALSRANGSPKKVIHQKTILFLLLGLGTLVAGCQSNIYYWGHYEDLVYATYARPDKATPELQVQVMEHDMLKAQAANKPLPPGFHAHLGYEYYQMGKKDLALQQFELEKSQFP